MKFKTKEEIFKEGKSNQTEWDDAFEEGLDEAFASFKERIDFHDKWKDRPIAFYECFGDKFNKGTLKLFSWILEDIFLKHDVDIAQKAYLDFLFNYCFSDVMK